MRHNATEYFWRNLMYYEYEAPISIVHKYSREHIEIIAVLLRFI